MSDVPQLFRSMSAPFNIDLSYPSPHGNFVGRDGLEGMIDDGAHQYITASSSAESAQIELHQDWVLQRLEELIAARANIGSKLQKFQALYHRLEYARAQQSAHLPLIPTTAPDVPFMTTSPYSTTTISPRSFSQTANLLPNQGETGNIPDHMPRPSTSQLSTTLYAQPALYLPPEYTVCNRAGKNVFFCECGHKASRKGDMQRHRQSIRHAKKRYVCQHDHCGKSYTRKDSLLRHATRHT